MIGSSAMEKAVFSLPCRFTITSYTIEAHVKSAVDNGLLPGDWPCQIRFC